MSMKKVHGVKKMQALRWSFIWTMALATTIFVGCGEDDEEPSALIGVYTVTSATLAEDTPNPNNQDETWPAGTDLIQQVGGAFAGAADCNNPQNTAIQLAEDNDFAYVCLTESSDPVSAGTWNENAEQKKITISLTSTSFGVPVSVSVVNYNLTGTSLTGTIENFPFSTNDGGVANLEIDIELTKVE